MIQEQQTKSVFNSLFSPFSVKENSSFLLYKKRIYDSLIFQENILFFGGVRYVIN